MVPRRAHPARSTALVIVLAAVGLALATRLMSLSNNATLSAQNGAPDAVALAQLASATPPPQAGTPGATATLPSTLTPVAGAFEVGLDLTIEYLRGLDIQGSEITIEQQLANGANYAQYIASYVSEGNRIYGLLTVPFGEMPPGGYKAIVFNHAISPRPATGRPSATSPRGHLGARWIRRVQDRPARPRQLRRRAERQLLFPAYTIDASRR